MFRYRMSFSAEAAEQIRNNGLYIIDPNTRKVRKPVTTAEWFTSQVVYVLNIQTMKQTKYYEAANDNFEIQPGEQCRCWNAHITI